MAEFEPVLLVSPRGNDFMAGSPEVVARLTHKGYKRKDEDRSAEPKPTETGGENKPANTDVNAKTGGGEGKPTADEPDDDAPQVTASTNAPPSGGNKPTAAKPTGK